MRKQFLFFIFLPFLLFSYEKWTVFHFHHFFEEDYLELVEFAKKEAKTASKHFNIVKVPEFFSKNSLDKISSYPIDIALLSASHWEGGLEQLGLFAESKNIAHLASYIADPKNFFFPKNHQYKIYPLKKGKIGVFSLISLKEKNRDLYLHKSSRNFLLLPPFFVAKSLVKKMKKKGCSFIILFSDLSLEEDLYLARAVPDIDLIMGAHEQETVALYEKDTLIYKTSSQKSSIDRLDLVIDRERCLGVDAPMFYPNFRKIVIHP